MTLQRRLARAMVLALVGLLCFLYFNAWFFRNIDQFVSGSLFLEIDIARTCEHLADRWDEIDDFAAARMSDPVGVEPLISAAQVASFQASIRELDGLMIYPAIRSDFVPVQALAESYLNKFREFERVVAQRGVIARRENRKRQDAGKAVADKVSTILKGYRKMMDDFSETLKNPDFQASMGTTSGVMLKISRIEKDLAIAETEVTGYLNISSGKDARTVGGLDRGGLSERLQKRLQAVIGLLTKSIEEATSPIQIRVFTGIRGKIQDFRRSFLELQDILERPESERMEVDDLAISIRKELSVLHGHGTALAKKEADFFWKKINATSSTLSLQIRENQFASRVFLLLALVFGSSFVIVFPRRIGSPLKKLNESVKHFTLGSDFTTQEPSGTTEVDSLSETFSNTALRLNAQAELIKKILATLKNMGEIYKELYIQNSQDSDSSLEPNSLLNSAINKILTLILENVPKIDFMKVMLKREAPKGSSHEFVFVRVGDPLFSENFQSHPEFPVYCKSVAWERQVRGELKEEIIPFGDGLSSQLFDFAQPYPVDDGPDYYKEIHKFDSVRELSDTAKGSAEKGLRGSFFRDAHLIPNRPLDPGVPLPPDHPIGIVMVYSTDPEVRLSGKDISIIQIMKAQIVSVFENDLFLKESEKKRKQDYQLSLAREIQENLLPRDIPIVPGLLVSRVSKSAADVGGDYYDCFPVGDRRLGVVIADAAGKNVPAAILMTVFKTTLSTMAKETMPASEVMTKANEIILKNITSDRFITAMYAIIDADSGEVELSSAGHNPALVVSGRGTHLTITKRSVPGIPLGISVLKYPSIRFHLNAGDLLSLYTDGVTEARNSERVEFGMSGLKKFLSGPRGPSPATDLLREVEDFAGGMPQFDDITALTIEFRGKSK